MSDMGDLKELCEAVGGLVQLVQVTQLLAPTLLVPAGQVSCGWWKLVT